MPITQAAIAAVASQPRIRSHPPTTILPMMRDCEVISIIKTIMGTDTMPLITALQYSAFIGSIPINVIATPSAVAAVRMP